MYAVAATLLRRAAALLRRHGQAVEPVEGHQLGGRRHGHRHHVRARGECLDADHAQEGDELADAYREEIIAQTAQEIEAYVRDEQAYLNPHLKIDDVVGHCQYGRTIVSLTFQRRFGSFANYVNGLRLAYYDRYVEEHPAETKESAALAAGFSSYNSYYRAKQKF